MGGEIQYHGFDGLRGWMLRSEIPVPSEQMVPNALQAANDDNPAVRSNAFWLLVDMARSGRLPAEAEVPPQILRITYGRVLSRARITDGGTITAPSPELGHRPGGLSGYYDWFTIDNRAVD